MTRRPRADEPGAWHHVFNRAIARRTLFERREDFRYFLACLAKAVRCGDLEVHAYVLMPTHYHLLVRSPNGRLAEAMHRIQMAYTRYFNRRRKRDGALVRTRYGSKRVTTLAYRRILVRYIDANVTRPRIVGTPEEYPWCSAVHHAAPAGPIWLERSWVQAELLRRGPELPALSYRQAFPVRETTALIELVNARESHRGSRDDFDDIVGASDSKTRTWMIAKALLADGTRPGLPVVAASMLEGVIGQHDSAPWGVCRGHSRRCGWQLARVGLGRDLAGETLAEIALRMKLSSATIGRLYAFHRAEVEERTAYSESIAKLASACVAALSVPNQVQLHHPGPERLQNEGAPAQGDAAEPGSVRSGGL